MEQKTYFFMPGLLLIILLLFIGCEGDIAAVGEDAYGPVEDAVVAVSVEWPDDAGGAMHAGAHDDDSSAAPMTASPVRLSDDCEGRGVDKVRVNIQSSSGAALKSATFDCSAGQGTLRGLEPQSNCRIVLSALDYSGNVTYEGRKTALTLRSGMNNIGTILVERIDNQPPTAIITNPSNNSTYTLGQSISFAGTATDPEDGDLPASAFVWESSPDGQINTGSKSFFRSDLSAGTHTITLTVTDSDGATGSDNITVTVKTPNQPPEANITAPSNNSIFTYGDIVSFIGTGMDPEDGDLPASVFVWESSLDGVIETGYKAFSTDFLSMGIHTITLKVTDSDGETDSATLSITISPDHNGYDGDTITNAIGMTFNYIEPGTFLMGSPPDEPGRWNDETQHQVTLTQGYYMQTTPVTQGEWETLMGSNPSMFYNCGSDCPVESVSWQDAQDFIAALNDLEDTNRYALPTEAQWEYAARAGSTTAFANGQITETGSGYDPVLDSMGWYSYNSQVSYSPNFNGKGTHPVGLKEPNAWGLYDMHGNVWEWVADWYGAYPTSAVVDPTGPASGTYRVWRGSDYSNDARFCRSAFRIITPGAEHYRNSGFRILLLPDQEDWVDDSSITYLNKTASLDYLHIEKQGQWNGAYTIFLIFEGPEAMIDLEMFFPSDSVSAGTYHWSWDRTAGTFSDFSDIYMHDEWDEITGGTVTIQQDGSQYIIEGNVRTEKGQAVFVYTGPGYVF